MNTMRAVAGLGLIASAIAWPLASGAFVYDESLEGDLSGDRSSPTFLSLAHDVNELAMTSGSATGSVDRDYFTFSVPDGWQLVAIRVLTANTDGVAFIGVQNGAVFSEPPLPTRVENLLGWHHFGSGEAGTDILGAIGTGAGAQGFTPPLGPGSYAFWAQDFGSVSAYSIAFDLSPVPEPGAGAMLAVGLLAIAAGRRRPTLG